LRVKERPDIIEAPRHIEVRFLTPALEDGDGLGGGLIRFLMLALPVEVSGFANSFEQGAGVLGLEQAEKYNDSRDELHQVSRPVNCNPRGEFWDN
jgi:hypothetical protein